LRPVARLGAAGPGLNADIGVGGVLRAAQHAPEFEGLKQGNHLLGFAAQFSLKRRILGAQFLEGLQVFQRLLNLLIGLEDLANRLEGADLLLGLFGVVPKGGFRLGCVELFAFLALPDDVKESLGGKPGG